MCDNCPITANPLQDDADKNCIGASCEHAARIAYIGWGDDEKYDQFIDIGNADPDIPLEAVFGTINVGQPPNPIWQRGSRTIEGDFVFSATDGVLPQDGFL